jgi:single-strand DNA-binding protein
MDLSKVTLLGVVGADPRTSEGNGGPTAVLRLAINRAERDRKTGALVRTTDWHTVVTVGKLATVVAKYVRTGDRLYVEGTLRARTQRSARGQTSMGVDVLALSLILLGSTRRAKKA